MGKKKSNGAYNDFLDGEKLNDNAQIRTTLQSSTPLTREISPPIPTRSNGTGHPNPNHSQRVGKTRDAQPKKPPLTHFLCLPLVTPTSLPQLQTSLSTLKQELMNNGTIPPSSVRPPSTLHLTLGVMSLTTPSALATALQHLHSLNLHTILRDITHLRIAEHAAESGTVSENLNAAAMPDTDALTVRLEGLLPMQKPGETSVLYAEARDGSGRLEEFAQQIRDGFVREGVLVPDGRPLRLHATVVNTIYAKKDMLRQKKAAHSKRPALREDGSDSGTMENGDAESNDTERLEKQLKGHGLNTSRSLRFDARDLIAQYTDFVWAEDVKIDRVYICKMGAKKIWSSGVEGVGEVVDEVYEVVAEKGIFE